MRRGARRDGLVAVHPRDIDGALRAGLAGIWVDRKRTPYSRSFLPPTVQVDDLENLAKILAAAAS